MKSIKRKVILLATVMLIFAGLSPAPAEKAPEFVTVQPDNRFAEVRVLERVIETHAPWKTDATREILRTGFFVNDYAVIAGGIRPDLAVSLTVRLSEESAAIPASITYFDTELGLALINLHTDATGNYTYYNAKRRKSRTRRLVVAGSHDRFTGSRHLRALGTQKSGRNSVFQFRQTNFEQYGSTLAPGGSVMIPTLMFSSYMGDIEPGDLLIEGRVLKGVVLRYDAQQKYGHAIPAPFVKQFCARAMKRSKSRKNKLFIEEWMQGKTRAPNTIVTDAGFTVAPLKNPPSRSYYGLKPYHQGAVVDQVLPYGGAFGKLEPNDVILNVGNRAVGPDATLADPVFGRLPLSAAVSLRRGVFNTAGRSLRLRIARNGQLRWISVKLAEFSQENLRVPVYEPQPQYAVVGGLVFVELSQAYLEQTPAAPDRLKYLADNSRYLDGRTRARYVVLDRILPVSEDLGYEGERLLVQSVNNIAVRDVVHLRRLVEQMRGSGDSVAFRLEGNRTMVLAPDTITRKNRDVRARYGIQFLYN